jgi:tetratricopeptide (TPR) repeat protein
MKDIIDPAPPSPEGDAWARAVSAQHAGDYASAAATFSSCPPDPVRGRAPADFHAAWCFEMAQQPAEATAHYTLAVERSREPALTIEAQFRLGWLALQEGKPELARRHLASLVQLANGRGLSNPTVEHARYWLAVCLEGEGQLIDAAARYQAVIDEGNPDLWHEAAYRRLLCVSQIGDLCAALAAAEALLRADRRTGDPARLMALQALARDEKAQIVRAMEAA